MGHAELIELLAELRASITRLAESRVVDQRELGRALAHLWSAHDELEVFSNQPFGSRLS